MVVMIHDVVKHQFHSRNPVSGRDVLSVGP